MQGSENKRLEVIGLAQDFHTLSNWLDSNTRGRELARILEKQEGTGQTMTQDDRNWPDFLLQKPKSGFNTVTIPCGKPGICSDNSCGTHSLRFFLSLKSD